MTNAKKNSGVQRYLGSSEKRTESSSRFSSIKPNISSESSEVQIPRWSRPSMMVSRPISMTRLRQRENWLAQTRKSIAYRRAKCTLTHELRFSETLRGLYCARFSPDGDYFAACFGTGGIQIRNRSTGELKATLKGGIESAVPVTSCRFNPVKKELFYVASANGELYMCNIETNELTRFIYELKNEINALDVSTSGEYIITGGKDATLRMYDSETGKLLNEYKKNEADIIENKVTRYHHMRIFAARFHTIYPDLIVTGGWDDTVKIWDIRIKDGSVKTIKGPHVCGDAIDMRESQILTGSWIVRDSLQIWDLMSAKLIETIRPTNRPKNIQGEYLYTVQYFDGDPYGDLVVAGGSGTGVLEVISIKSNSVMGTLEVNKPIVTIDTSNTCILFGGMESVIRLADYS